MKINFRPKMTDYINDSKRCDDSDMIMSIKIAEQKSTLG